VFAKTIFASKSAVKLRDYMRMDVFAIKIKIVFQDHAIQVQINVNLDALQINFQDFTKMGVSAPLIKNAPLTIAKMMYVLLHAM
jgi:hypothetical protein